MNAADKMNVVCLDVMDLPDAVGLKTGDRVTATMDLVLTRDVENGKLYANIENPEIEMPEAEAPELPPEPTATVGRIATGPRGGMMGAKTAVY